MTKKKRNLKFFSEVPFRAIANNTVTIKLMKIVENLIIYFGYL